MDDLLSFPLDSVIEAVPGAVILDSGVTARRDQSTGNVFITIKSIYSNISLEPFTCFEALLPVLTGHQKWSSVMLVQNINLATGVAQEQVNNVHPLVRHGLEQSVLAVPALEVDIDLGMGDELPDCCHVAIPDGVGEGRGAVVCGQVDVDIRPLEQNSDNV